MPVPNVTAKKIGVPISHAGAFIEPDPDDVLVGNAFADEVIEE
jgi:hypothetical protein